VISLISTKLCIVSSSSRSLHRPVVPYGLVHSFLNVCWMFYIHLMNMHRSGFMIGDRNIVLNNYETIMQTVGFVSVFKMSTLFILMSTMCTLVLTACT